MKLEDITIGAWYVVNCLGYTFAAKILHKELHSVLIHDGDSLVKISTEDVVSPAEIINEH